MVRLETLIQYQNIIGFLKSSKSYTCFGISKFLNLLVYKTKISIEFTMKCIPVNGGRNNNKSTLLKSLLYLSEY